MPYSLLAQNIADQIMEEQAKLGFDEKEIRLYYPLSSLCHIINYFINNYATKRRPRSFLGILKMVDINSYSRKIFN